jgi:uncharacterized membrane protein YgcG
MAVDFWGGVAAPEELVPFPGGSSAEPPAGDQEALVEGPVIAGPSVVTERLRVITRMPGRRAAAGLAILFFALVAVRTLGAQSTRTRAGARPDKVAQVGPGRVTDFRDEPRRFGQRRLARAQTPRANARGPRQTKHSHASRAPSHSVASAGRPVSYSRPPTTTSSATSSGEVASSGSVSSGTTSSGGSSGSGGGGSGSSGGSSDPGPTGPGATFGPGRLGPSK